MPAQAQSIPAPTKAVAPSSVRTKPTRRSDHEAQPRASLRTLIEGYRPRISGVLVFVGYLLLSWVAFEGWQSRAEQPLTPESGLGYALGIVGGTLMLLLLLYPLRKRLSIMRHLGPIRYWFRTHMLFGVLGPVLILYHSGFRLGSTNANVALFCMLAVAGSGLFGRYFYTRIHHGLYGRRATLEELRRDVETLKAALETRLRSIPEIHARLEAFDARAAAICEQPTWKIWQPVWLGAATWWAYLSLRHYLRGKIFEEAIRTGCSPRQARRLEQHYLRHVGARLASVRKIAELRIYERLFSVWHIVHFPLFLMLVVSGLVHVLAVHIY